VRRRLRSPARGTNRALRCWWGGMCRTSASTAVWSRPLSESANVATTSLPHTAADEMKSANGRVTAAERRGAGGDRCRCEVGEQRRSSAAVIRTGVLAERDLETRNLPLHAILRGVDVLLLLPDPLPALVARLLAIRFDDVRFRGVIADVARRTAAMERRDIVASSLGDAGVGGYGRGRVRLFQN